MVHVDVLTAYLICGVSSLAGAAILRLARTDDPRLRPALRVSGQALLILGVGLMPAGLGDGAGHPAAQFGIGFSCLVAVSFLARALALMGGRELPAPALAALISVLGVMLGVTLGGSLGYGMMPFGRSFALGLAVTTSLAFWSGRSFVQGPHSLAEKGLGLALAVLAVTSWLRLAFTLAYDGPPRVDLLYVPQPVAPLLGALYGVMPIIIATLLLSLVNARLHQQLHSRATIDELTGAMTRRALRELAPYLIETEQAGQRDVAVLMIDLDHFKSVNDCAGHAGGDRVLRLSAQAMRAQLRQGTLFARYGGEEFVAVIPVEELPVARRISERLRLAVESTDWRSVPGLNRPVTVSVGVALVGPCEALDDALRRADEALYRAKREGRNQVQMSMRAA